MYAKQTKILSILKTIIFEDHGKDYKAVLVTLKGNLRVGEKECWFVAPIGKNDIDTLAAAKGKNVDISYIDNTDVLIANRLNRWIESYKLKECKIIN